MSREPKGSQMSTKIEFQEGPEGIVFLRIKGDFTNQTTPQYQKICNDVMEKPDVKIIILDFKEVTSLDTSAFACMINFIKEHETKDVRIGIIHIQKQQKDLLEILRLQKEIFYFDSAQKAIAELTHRAE